jgi:hypothetical protein
MRNHNKKWESQRQIRTHSLPTFTERQTAANEHGNEIYRPNGPFIEAWVGSRCYSKPADGMWLWIGVITLPEEYWGRTFLTIRFDYGILVTPGG